MNIKKKLVALATTAACAVSGMSLFSLDLSNVNAEELSNRTAFQITREMKVGWNLGNSLDAYNTNLSDPTPYQTETAWGNPVTTQAMIDAVKAKGFNTVRVPTTWFQHVDSDFNIDADYLARVKEVVDYCFNDGLYVILNVHHEETWINRSDFDTAYDDMSWKLKKIWSQIATAFADYDQHLVFEGMNEPRAAGTTREWWGATAADKEVINKLDADFVNTVRSVDSKYRTSRLLMIPAYCASSDPSIYGSLVVPNDDHVAVSVHAYSPYSFVMDETATHDTFTSAYKSELNTILKNVRNKFISNNIPVVIGEMSASNYNNTSARIEWAETYASTAKAYGMPVVLWDNNVITNPTNPAEAHGYLNRSNLTWYDGSSQVVDSLINTYNSSAITFGSDAIAPSFTHADINSGTQLGNGTYNLDASVENGNCTPFFNFNWSMLDGKEIAVQFSGETPKAAMMDSSWNNWTDPDPYEVSNGIAYYSLEDLKAKWSASTDPATIGFAIYSGTTTITKISIIDAPTVTQGGSLVIDDPVENPTEEQPTTQAPTEEQPTTQTPTEEQQPTTEQQPTEQQPTTEQPATQQPPTSIVQPSMRGDVDKNGTPFTTADAVILAKYIANANLYGLSEEQIANSDINGDSTVNAADLIDIIEFVIGKKSA